MAVFTYKAVQGNGSSIEGSIDAGGRQDAVRMIEERGLTPVRVTESTSPQTNGSRTALKLPSAKQFSFKSNRVTFSALEDFTRSLSSLLAANVPLSRALTILYKESSNPVASAKWKELHDFVIDGVPLATAMGRAPDVFPRVYVAMVEAGEAGGFLDVVLAQIADFQAREKELRAKVMSAMMYPAVLLTLAVAVLVFLMVFFIPRFTLLFAGFDAALPALTQAIVGISDAIRHYGFYMLAAIGAAVYFGRNWFAKESSRRLWESWLLRMPVIGPLAAKLALARFCRMLGTLLGAGVSLISALSVSRRSLGNQTLIDLVTDATAIISSVDPPKSARQSLRLAPSGSPFFTRSVASVTRSMSV